MSKKIYVPILLLFMFSCNSKRKSFNQESWPNKVKMIYFTKSEKPYKLDDVNYLINRFHDSSIKVAIMDSLVAEYNNGAITIHYKKLKS